MEVLDTGRKTYPEDPTRFLDFKRFNSLAGDFVLLEGYYDFRELEKLRGRRIVHLELEDPNRFVSGDPLFHHVPYEEYFDKVFTICPYTASWLNAKYGNDKRVPAFFPFNETLAPPVREKKFDVIYTGSLLAKSIPEVVKTISKYRYRCVSHSDHPLVTDRDASNQRKLELISQTRISVVHNLLYLSNRQIKTLHKVDGFRDNRAYDLVPHNRWLWRLQGSPEVAAPQLKSRVFEAAFSHTLILCRSDPFNIIETVFEPDKEFVYYEHGRLDEKIREILADYGDYQPVVKNAYERAMSEYTTEAFFHRFLKDL